MGEGIISKIYDKVCENILRIYISVVNLLGYKIINETTDNKQIDSLIVANEDIQILDLTKNMDKENIIKYLRHHIMYTDDEFYKMYFFDGPLIARFKYQNEIYQICLSQLESKNHEQSVVMKEPKYLSAVIKNDENDEGNCITSKFVELHGPNRNFFKHISDTVSDFSVILKDHKGKLHTFDMMGNNQIHDLNSDLES